MKMNEFKTKVGNFWRDNKGMIIIAGGVVGGLAIAATKLCENKSDPDVISEEKTGEWVITAHEGIDDDGRDLLMVFSVEDTGEVLWKERCTEGYMQAYYKDSGMQYEGVRKLNGLE